MEKKNSSSRRPPLALGTTTRGARAADAVAVFLPSVGIVTKIDHWSLVFLIAFGPCLGLCRAVRPLVLGPGRYPPPSGPPPALAFAHHTVREEGIQVRTVWPKRHSFGVLAPIVQVEVSTQPPPPFFALCCERFRTALCSHDRGGGFTRTWALVGRGAAWLFSKLCFG